MDGDQRCCMSTPLLHIRVCRGLYLVRVMVKDWMATGLKLRMRGYRSMGLRVPEVMTTVWNFWKTGLTARLASRQLNCNHHGRPQP